MSKPFEGVFSARNATWFLGAMTLVFLVSWTVPVAIGSPIHESAVTYPVPKKFVQNGEFEIFLRQNGVWKKVSSLPFDRFYREQTLEIPEAPASSKRHVVRLKKTGGGAAHIDAISLSAIAPVSVSGSREAQAGKLVAKPDFDVLDASSGIVEFSFPARRGRTLSLVARIESERIADIPFRFPLSNQSKPIRISSDFYQYRWGGADSGKTLKGKALERTAPFFREFCRAGTGHPSSDIYGWVSNDEKNLYVRIDLTGDNTRDGNKDYSAVYVKTASGVKEFKVSEADTAWGTPGFTYTDKVPYRHKVYNFTIPRDQLGLAKMPANHVLNLAFAAYGTEGPALWVVSTSPDNNAVNVPVDNTISATFNLAINQSTVDDTSFVVERTSDGSPVAGTFSFSADNTVVTFIPDTALDNNTNYTVTLPEDSIVSQTGSAYLWTDYVWTFTTAGGDNTVTLFFQNTPSIFGCAVAPGKATWKESAAALCLFILPALVLFARKRRGTGERGHRTLFRGFFPFLLAAAMILAASAPSHAGALGPPQPSVKAGQFGGAIGYFYTEDKWEPDTASVQSGGVTVRWETDKVKQNSVFLRGAYGFSANCEASVKVGIADRGAPQGFEDSYGFLAGVGAKGILYETPSFSVGPILDFTWYSDYEDNIAFSQGGTTWSGKEKIEDSWDLQVGIGLQAPVGKGMVYGGPSFFWNRADVTYQITNGVVNLNVDNKYNQKNTFGGFAGVRYPVSDRLGIEIEGQYRSGFSAGATILYAF